ncbi:MAG: nuclear transport factor 2 family protein [Cyclobacteriaceae bacterium]
MYFFILTLIFPLLYPVPQTTDGEKQVLQLVENFFIALEKQDTTAFKNIFLKDARNYAVRDVKDSVIVRSQPSSGFRFTAGQVLKERLRKKTTIAKIEGRIAMVWAPYDLWINDTFSHCGVDVFTLIKTSEGWRIASIAYTMEKTGC